MATMLCDAFVIVAAGCMHPQCMIHATTHVDHEKRVAWFSISMHACGSVPISYCDAILRVTL